MLNRGSELTARLLEIHLARFFFIRPGYVLVFGVLTALSIPVSLFLIWQIRRKPKAGAAST